MKTIESYTVLLIPIGRWHRLTKQVLKLMIFILIFVENLMQYDAIYDFSVRLRIGSDPADINGFRSHTGKIFAKSPNFI